MCLFWSFIESSWRACDVSRRKHSMKYEHEWSFVDEVPVTFQSSCISSRRSYADLTLSRLFAHQSSLAGADARADFLFFFKPSTSDNTRVVRPNPLKRPVLRAGLLCLSLEFVSSRQCEQEGHGFHYWIWNQGLSVLRGWVLNAWDTFSSM